MMKKDIYIFIGTFDLNVVAHNMIKPPLVRNLVRGFKPLFTTLLMMPYYHLEISNWSLVTPCT